MNVQLIIHSLNLTFLIELKVLIDQLQTLNLTADSFDNRLIGLSNFRLPLTYSWTCRQVSVQISRGVTRTVVGCLACINATTTSSTSWCGRWLTSISCERDTPRWTYLWLAEMLIANITTKQLISEWRKAQQLSQFTITRLAYFLVAEYLKLYSFFSLSLLCSRSHAIVFFLHVSQSSHMVHPLITINNIIKTKTKPLLL